MELRQRNLGISTSRAMVDMWRERVSSEEAHFRELAGLPGTGQKDCLPIENHSDIIFASIEANSICGVRSPPGSGKTMILPELLYDWAEKHARGGWQRLPQAVVIVFPTQYGCLKIKESLLDFRGHDSSTVVLRTGVDKDDVFYKGVTKFQIVTYGMMWQWLVKSGPETYDNLFEHNCAFLLDEFSGKAAGGDPQTLAADPQTMEIARLLAGFVLANPQTHRLLVTGASLDQDLMNVVLPRAKFLSFTERMFPLKRCIIAPRKPDEILTLCAQLICITIESDTGNILVFLPGIDDILRVDKLVKQKLGGRAHGIDIVRLHSHLLGEGETGQDHAETSSASDSRKLYLSSLIAARGVTLPDITYVFIHPYQRTTFLHQSGLETLGEERISAELCANMAGRGGRTAPAWVVYLFEFNDAAEALMKIKDKRRAQTPFHPGESVRSALPSVRIGNQSTARTSAPPRVPLFRAPPSVEVPAPQHATLILAPPSRLAYVEGTMRQLQERRFPKIYWLRTPDPLELDTKLRTNLAPKQRVMALWRTTVLPAVMKMCEKYKYTGVMVVEDTVLLAPEVFYSDIAREIQQSQARAGVWGYGKKWENGWSGSKGLFMTPDWCEEIDAMLENTNLEQYEHFDIWLMHLQRQQKARGFVCLSLIHI